VPDKLDDVGTRWQGDQSLIEPHVQLLDLVGLGFGIGLGNAAQREGGRFLW
jgi:hypothetical protein